MKKWDLVTDTSASGRYNKAIYRLVNQCGDQWIVEYVGDVVGGRLQASNRRDQTYRNAKNLQEWK